MLETSEIASQPRRGRPDWAWFTETDGLALNGAFPLGSSIGVALLAFGVMVVTIIIFAIIVIPFTGIDGLRRHAIGFGVAAQLLGYGATLPVLLYGIERLGRRSLWGLGIRPHLTGRVVTAAVAGGLLMTIVVDGLSGVIESVVGHHEQDALQMLHQLHSPVMLTLFVIMAVIAAPITEEVFFRGLIFNALYVRMPLWGAAVISGFLFGAAHMDRILFVPLWLGGILLAVLYARYRNIMVNIGAHMIFNAIGILASLYVR